MRKVKFLKYSVVLFLFSALITCDEYVRTEVEKNIYVNKMSLDLFVGDEIQLIASPTRGTLQYSWTSENTEVATVDNNGLVKVVNEGFTNIVVKSGSIETKVPLNAVVRIPLEDVVLSDTQIELLPGNSKSILVTYVPDDANDLPSETWLSENEEIVTVNENGEISVVGEGVTRITYRIGDITKIVNVDVAYTRPFLGPHILSGDLSYELMAANFDTGGEGYAFHDSDAVNGTNNAYRRNNGDSNSEAVDIEGNGTNIGHTAVNEWLVYTLEVAEAGMYKVEVSLSARYDRGKFHLEVNNQDVTGTVIVPSNNSWNAWRWFTTPAMVLDLPEGSHRFKFYFEGDGFNLRGFRFTKI